MVFGDRLPRKEKREQVPLNDDPNALPDHEYAALLVEAEKTAEPCPAAVPADEVAAAVARLDDAEGDANG
jgi:hypothetical protein